MNTKVKILWYPVIDKEKCIKCGNCVSNCNRGVYDKNEFPKPEVIKPENCYVGCTGCARKCPVGAITYVDLRNEVKNEE